MNNQQVADLSRRALIKLIEDYDKDNPKNKVEDYLHAKNDNGEEYELIRPVEFITKEVDGVVGFCKDKICDMVKASTEFCANCIKDKISEY